MHYHQLGRSPLQVSSLIFGGNVFGWTVDEAQSFRLLDAMVDAGLQTIDTADVYSRWANGNVGGESERIIGTWMKQRGNRANVVVLTKAGMDMGDGRIGLSRKWLTTAVEDSLRRLQTDYIDLYQAHRDDEAVPLDETLDTYARLIEQGKVRVIGASNYTAPRLRAALAVSAEQDIPRYESLQPRYNLYDRTEFEDELAALCQQETVGVIPYSSLASGFLTGKYRSEQDFGKSKRGGGMPKYLNLRGLRILDALDTVAARYDTSPTHIALAWLRQRPAVTAPIVSATTVEQLQTLIASLSIDITIEDSTLLEQAST